MGDLSENFSRSEFACKCCGEQIEMNADLIKSLQKLRTIYGKPITINSGYRCPEHNKAVGGVNDSEHVTGEAVDISCTTSQLRYELVELSLCRFQRIGIAKTFLHFGVGKAKSQDVIWVY